jgi:tRNA splicing ligase
MVTKLKRLHGMEENLCQLYIWQKVDNQNIQGSQKAKFPKKSVIKWKNGQMN